MLDNNAMPDVPVAVVSEVAEGGGLMPEERRPVDVLELIGLCLFFVIVWGLLGLWLLFEAVV